MRVVKNPQIQLGEVDISQIKIDTKSRDDIPKILRGLQHIYINTSIREEIFKLLEKMIAPKINKKNGRPGMELWKIFVMGIMRLDLNCDYDRLQELVNSHKTIRQMLGHPDFADEYYYEMQTIKDNVSLLTPELLEEINEVIVRAGHVEVKKKENEVLRGRCDSFVVETDVHYPTDINLLLDAMRKTIELTARLSESYGLSEWRQSAYNIRHLKRLMRKAQNKKRTRGKTEEQQRRCEIMIKSAHREYINVSEKYLNKASNTIDMLEKQEIIKVKDILIIDNIIGYINHAKRQINQINRRVLCDENIAHDEKVFSIFEPHTEWVCKGKAGVPVELGIKVCILEDQYQFILHHKVMEKETDDQVTVEMVKETKKRFKELNSCSFDKGFHSPANQEILSEELELVALPRKGRLSKQAQEIEKAESFVEARRKHSAVESAINGLEVHGLDRCLDHGINGFKRYCALAIVARNIARIGAILQKREQKKMKRLNKALRAANSEYKIAA